MSRNIVSWTFVAHAHAIGIKFENGILYFDSVYKIKSLTYWYIRDLARKKPIKSNDTLDMFRNLIEKESNTGWKYVTP